MFKTSEIHPLTGFQRNAKTHIERLHKHRRPELLTVHGQPEVVVQDAEAYEELLSVVERAEAILGIQRGLESLRAGRGQSIDEAFAAIRKELGVGEAVE